MIQKILFSIRNYFHHPIPHPDLEEERKNQLVVFFGLNIALFGVLMFTARTLLEDNNPKTVFLLPMGSVIALVSLHAIKFWNNSRIPTYAMLLCGSFIIFFRALSTGGIYSPVSLWMVFMPGVAILLLPPRQSLFWLVICIGGLFVLAYPAFFHLPYSLNESSVTVKFLVLSLLILMLSFMMFFFESERKKNERKIRETESMLATSNKLVALGNLSGGMAHEINTPLAVIRGHAHFLNKTLRETPEAESINLSLHEIELSVTRISGIVNSLRTFTKDDFYPTLNQVDLGQTVQDAVRDLQHKLSRHNIKVSANIPPQLMILGIREFVHRILCNLMENSIEAIKGHPSPWVKLVIEKKSDFIVLRISDSGDGIDSLVTGRMWDPFFTTRAIGDGSGLGLTVAHNLIKLQNGSISYEAHDGHTSFIIHFRRS